MMPGPMAQPAIRLDHMSITSVGYSRPCRVFTQAMSANRAMSAPPASNLRLTGSSTGPPPGCAFPARGALGARACDAVRLIDVRTPMRLSAKSALGAPHMPRTSLLTRAINPASPRRASRARSALPRAVAPAGRPERGAHLRDRPPAFAGENELELRPLRRLSYSCLPAKRALAFKSISSSLFSRSLSRLSPRRPSAIWNGLPPARNRTRRPS